jgi:hypothetical protein
MRKVERSDILDYQTYADRREDYRRHVLEEKAKRRIHVGEHLTFLFESTDTIKYQVQEMMRLEHIAREKDIVHEIDTYNQLLGGPGELGCTLLIEIEDAAERAPKLSAWVNLPQHLYIRLEDGSQVRAQWDQAQVGDTRLSSVQYLKFAIGQRSPAAIGCDHPELSAETTLSEQQRQTLRADLGA